MFGTMERWRTIPSDEKFVNLEGMPIEVAQRVVTAYVEDLFAILTPEVRSRLPEFESVPEFRPDSEVVAELDRQSFGFDEVGKTDDSSAAFATARFAAACLYLNSANSLSDLYEAAYEAYHAQLANSA